MGATNVGGGRRGRGGAGLRAPLGAGPAPALGAPHRGLRTPQVLRAWAASAARGARAPPAPPPPAPRRLSPARAELLTRPGDPGGGARLPPRAGERRGGGARAPARPRPAPRGLAAPREPHVGDEARAPRSGEPQRRILESVSRLTTVSCSYCHQLVPCPSLSLCRLSAGAAE